VTKDETYRNDIIEMARQAQQESFVGDKGHWFKMEAKDLERFAKLVAAKEREACAKECDKAHSCTLPAMLAMQIRARGEA
jgi:kynureninase